MGDVLMKSTLAVDHSSTAVATPISHSTAVATAPDTMNRPLRLLDLPVDILKDIVKEVRDDCVNCKHPIHLRASLTASHRLHIQTTSLPLLSATLLYIV